MMWETFTLWPGATFRVDYALLLAVAIVLGVVAVNFRAEK